MRVQFTLELMKRSQVAAVCPQPHYRLPLLVRTKNNFKIILEKCRIMQWPLVQFHLLRIQMPLQNGTQRDDKLFKNSFNIPFHT